MFWHVLDVRSIWIREFTGALSAQTPALGWLPQIHSWPWLRSRGQELTMLDPPMRVQRFTLPRGFARAPVRYVVPTGRRLAEVMGAHSPGPAVLVCTAPHFEGVARHWAGPVVYYVTDYFPAYGENPARILALDRRMCARAELVCPNSERIADYLAAEAGCDPAKITVVPNATRARNVLSEPLLEAALLPADIADLPRPVAGVIGNLASNIDWVLLRETVERTPWLSWVLVGPTEMAVPPGEQREARRRLMHHGERVRFIGYKPYAQLCDYARALDVAVLPYLGTEPTYSGSSTRFDEHLAACRPILASCGFAELLSKEPLLRLFRDAGGAVALLEQLRARDFCDGEEEHRWRQSRMETWEARANAMRAALEARCTVPACALEAARLQPAAPGGQRA